MVGRRTVGALVVAVATSGCAHKLDDREGPSVSDGYAVRTAWDAIGDVASDRCARGDWTIEDASWLCDGTRCIVEVLAISELCGGYRIELDDVGGVHRAFRKAGGPWTEVYASDALLAQRAHARK